jgi:DNA adenine methylase
MAALLATLKGRFILSLNDVEEVRRTFAGFEIETVETVYSVHDKRPGKKAGEVIITGPFRSSILCRAGGPLT